MISGRMRCSVRAGSSLELIASPDFLLSIELVCQELEALGKTPSSGMSV
jgi:hypothetical protein